MKRSHVALDDHGYPLIWRDELSRWPRPTAADWKALAGLVVVVLMIVALCAVPPEAYPR